VFCTLLIFTRISLVLGMFLLDAMDARYARTCILSNPVGCSSWERPALEHVQNPEQRP
jgi:hypothetical protein